MTLIWLSRALVPLSFRTAFKFSHICFQFANEILFPWPVVVFIVNTSEVNWVLPNVKLTLNSLSPIRVLFVLAQSKSAVSPFRKLGLLSAAVSIRAFVAPCCCLDDLTIERNAFIVSSILSFPVTLRSALRPPVPSDDWKRFNASVFVKIDTVLSPPMSAGTSGTAGKSSGSSWGISPSAHEIDRTFTFLSRHVSMTRISHLFSASADSRVRLNGVSSLALKFSGSISSKSIRMPWSKLAKILGLLHFSSPSSLSSRTFSSWSKKIVKL